MNSQITKNYKPICIIFIRSLFEVTTHRTRNFDLHSISQVKIYIIIILNLSCPRAVLITVSSSFCFLGNCMCKRKLYFSYNGFLFPIIKTKCICNGNRMTCIIRARHKSEHWFTFHENWIIFHFEKSCLILDE